MFKLTAVTLAALFAILQIFGAPERRVEVTRAVSDVQVSKFSFSDFLGIKADAAEVHLTSDRVSDAEAVRMAMNASAAVRTEQDTATLRGVVLAAARETPPPPVPATVDTTEFWYVTGTTVNLRQGPGTGNAVIGSVTLGTEAEVLSDSNGWYEIRTADGATSGWIYGKFLSDQQPG